MDGWWRMGCDCCWCVRCILLAHEHLSSGRRSASRCPCTYELRDFSHALRTQSPLHWPTRKEKTFHPSFHHPLPGFFSTIYPRHTAASISARSKATIQVFQKSRGTSSPRTSVSGCIHAKKRMMSVGCGSLQLCDHPCPRIVLPIFCDVLRLLEPQEPVLALFMRCTYQVLPCLYIHT